MNKSDFLDYDTIHDQHRGSVYSHNRTTGLSRTGYAFMVTWLPIDIIWSKYLNYKENSEI